jgi:hypothetical protein
MIVCFNWPDETLQVMKADTTSVVVKTRKPALHFLISIYAVNQHS